MFHDTLIPIAGFCVPFAILIIGRLVSKADQRKERLEHDTQEIVGFITANKGKIAKMEDEQRQFAERLRISENEIARLNGRINGFVRS